MEFKFQFDCSFALEFKFNIDRLGNVSKSVLFNVYLVSSEETDKNYF